MTVSSTQRTGAGSRRAVIPWALGALLIFAGQSSLRSQIVVSEILASNQNDLRDDQLDTPDWIELHNPTDRTVSLFGWFLSDNMTNPTKWEFPDVEIPPRGYLTVLASGRHQVDPTRPLHTNFRLLRSGEFLGLFRPDGATVSWQFTPEFPSQIPDVSYGYAQPVDETVLLDPGAPGVTGSALVPQDDSLGTEWTAVDFPDDDWVRGPLAIGFDQKSNATYSHVIQTDIGDAMKRQNASAYIRIPFDVDGTVVADLLRLSVMYEDGFVAYLNGVEVARANAPAELTWDARSDGRQNTSEALTFEDFNVAGAGDLLRIGKNVLAIHGMNDSPNSSDFFVLPRLSAVAVGPIDTQSRRFFETTTPSWPNGEGFEDISALPEFSSESGSFTDDFELTLASPSGAGTIVYTLDGSDPTRESTVYEAPIAVTETMTVKARLIEPDLLPSPVVSQTYLKVHASAADFDSNLPVVVVNTFGRGVGESIFTPIHLTIFDTGDDGRTSLASSPSFQGPGGLKLRGSSSLGFPKKQFALETWDVDNEDLDVPLLGFAPESDWILYAPYSDKALMRNVLSYQWSNWIGRYAVKTKFVELFLNTSSSSTITSSNYWGVYVLMEKIKIGPDRVDIQEMLASDAAEPEVTGGYILKKDRLDPGDRGFTTSRGQTLAYYAPKEREASAAQKDYIRSYLNRFEQALYGPNFMDPDEGYEKYIDVPSFIDHHIMVELTKNIDGYRLSTFMFKDRNGKLNMGPIWDYNLSLGNANYLQGQTPTGWYYPQISAQQYPWYPRLQQDPNFTRRYNERWSELRRTVFTTERLLQSIDEWAELLQEGAERNFQRWRILGSYVWPNADGYGSRRTFASEVTWMKSWLVNRVNWMDSQLVTPPRIEPPGGFVEPGLEVTIASPGGDVYYTTDGEDPKGGNGAPSPTARLYEGEVISIERNTRVRARLRLASGSWSDMADEVYVTFIPDLAITEIMYQPQDGTDFEFLELYNYGTEPVNLRGSVFRRGAIFEFQEDSPEAIQPGEYMVFVRDIAAFEARYGTEGILVGGEYRGTLSDRGETMALDGPIGEPIFEFDYDPEWYPEASGGGYSIVLKDPTSPSESWSLAESWQPSAEVGGSPGRPDPGVSLPGGQVPGDGNQDGRLNILDVIHLTHFVFAVGAARLPCGDGSANDPSNSLLFDSTGDSRIDAADVVFNLRFLFLGGTPPAAGTSCGRQAGCPEACLP